MLKYRFRPAEVFGSSEDTNFRITVTDMHFPVSVVLYHLRDDISLSFVSNRVYVSGACAAIFCMSIFQTFFFSVRGMLYVSMPVDTEEPHVFCCVKEHMNRWSVKGQCFFVLLQF